MSGNSMLIFTFRLSIILMISQIIHMVITGILAQRRGDYVIIEFMPKIWWWKIETKVNQPITGKIKVKSGGDFDGTIHHLETTLSSCNNKINIELTTKKESNLDSDLLRNNQDIRFQKDKPIYIDYKVSSESEDSGYIKFTFKVDRCFPFLLPKNTYCKKINIKFTK